jgi:hypothetical protein
MQHSPIPSSMRSSADFGKLIAAETEKWGSRHLVSVIPLTHGHSHAQDFQREEPS